MPQGPNELETLEPCTGGPSVVSMYLATVLMNLISSLSRVMLISSCEFLERLRQDSTILYYTILYYTILYYTILYYTILYYTILYYTILYYTILYYTILHYTILYYTLLYSAPELSKGIL